MRVLGWLAVILGVIGCIACLVVALGGWVVRPMVSDKAHEIVALVDEGITKADTLAQTADGHLTDISGKLTTIQGLLTSVANSPIVDTAVGTRIRDAISGFIEGPYANVKTDVSGLLTQVESLSNTVQRLDAAIPGLELPGIVTGTVDDVAQKLTTLDQTVTSIDQIAGNGVTTSQQVQGIADQVGQINDIIGVVQPALGQARTEMADVQTRLVGVNDRIDRNLTIIAALVTIFFVWIALLHILLFQQGRRWIAASKAPAAG